MPQTFMVKPFFNLDSSEGVPKQVAIAVPKGGTVAVEQMYNFIFLRIHFDLAAEDAIERTMLLAFEGEEVPSNYEHIGVIVANETTDDTASEPMPQTDEEFYDALTILNVYISPETTQKRDPNKWSFLNG
jgi:hypothetical protein